MHAKYFRRAVVYRLIQRQLSEISKAFLIADGAATVVDLAAGL
jgi:hypothetical protein